MKFKRIGCEGLYWIYMAQSREQWRSVLILQINLQFRWKAEVRRKTHEDSVKADDKPRCKNDILMDHIRFDQESAVTHFSEIFGKFLDSIKILFFLSSLVTIHYRNKTWVIQANSVYVNRKMGHNAYIKFMPLVNIITASIRGLILFSSLHSGTNCNKNIISHKAVGGTSV